VVEVVEKLCDGFVFGEMLLANPANERIPSGGRVKIDVDSFSSDAL
jgi:hypothetical protein